MKIVLKYEIFEWNFETCLFNQLSTSLTKEIYKTTQWACVIDITYNVHTET